jgi:hypothetical protein
MPAWRQVVGSDLPELVTESPVEQASEQAAEPGPEPQPQPGPQPAKGKRKTGRQHKPSSGRKG